MQQLKEYQTEQVGHIYTQTGNFVPVETLKNYELPVTGDTTTESFAIMKSDDKGNESKQLLDEDDWCEIEGLLPHPYNVDSLLTLHESSPYYFRCVNQTAVDSAGMGWTLDVVEGKKENEALKNKYIEFLDEPSDVDSIYDIGQQMIIDFGSVGWLCLEVARDSRGDVAKVFHLPAGTIWVHKDKEKYAQKRGMKLRWFKKFGLKDNISMETGKEGEFPEDKTANELIFRRNYFPRITTYGAPNGLSAIGAIVGMMGILDYNVSFFENYGIPAYLIKLSGKWEPGAEKLIENFLNTEIKKSDNAHKTMVLKLPDQGEIVIERLSVDTKEGSFRLFNQAWREEVLTAHAMPPYRVGLAIVGTLGGNVATEMTAIYNTSVVVPHNRRLEYIWNTLIFKKGMGLDGYAMKYTKLDTRDLDKEVERDVMLSNVGAMSANELRAKYDLGNPIEGGDKYQIQEYTKPPEQESTKKAVRTVLTKMIADGEITVPSGTNIDDLDFSQMIQMLNKSWE